MARINGVDLPREKRVEIGLTYIYGIGRTTATKICNDCNINVDTRVRDLTEAQLQMLNTLLNTTFTGLTLAEITPELMRVAQHAAGEAYGLISLVVSFAMEVLEGLEQRRVHTSGLAHLLELPEYQSLDRAQPLMSYLSEDADPARFPVPKDDPMKILIGPENVADALKDTSVVVASYDIGEGMRGVIGVVGPTRMDYAKITARLSYLADGLSRLFGQGELPQGRDEEK